MATTRPLVPVLRIKTEPPEKLEELVLSLERGSLRLTRLIDNLLESVRIESGQLDMRRQSLSLRDVVEDARGLVDALLHQRHQALDVEVAEDLELQGDATRLGGAGAGRTGPGAVDFTLDR